MFQGSIPALVTPFRDGEVDFTAFHALIDWQIESGSSALVACGTTGESSTLSIDEHHRVIDACIAASDGRVPVIAGAGSNDTATSLTHMRHAKQAGAAAALVVTPYYNKPSQEGMYQHFATLAEGCDLPIIIYNIPGRSVVDLHVETLARLIDDLPNIVALKDATGDLGRVPAQRLACGADFCQLSGNDDMAVGFNALGGVGCISVTANVAPALCAQMQTATARGDYARALQLNDRLYPLHVALFRDASPGPVKYALSRLGRMDGETRLPITPPLAPARQAVDAALRALDLI